MRFVAGRAAVADGMGHHGRDVAGRAAVAKMLAEPMRTGGAAAAEHLQRGSDVVERLQRGSAVAECHQEDAACLGRRAAVADHRCRRRQGKKTDYRL